MIAPKLEVTNLISPLINSYKTINDEWKHFFDIGISEYLNSQTEKHYFTHTFIHRSEKVRFSNIYYPIKAAYKELTTDFHNLNDIFENYKNITLVGTAGSGKTTLLKHIFLHTIKTTKKIPILIELRNLNEFNGDIEKIITDKILKSKIKPNDSTFKRTLESGSFLFLFDGYDEIFSNKKQEINRQIEQFVDSYSKNNFLITTRPGSGIEGFSRFYDFKVCDLRDNDVDGFILKIVEEKERRDRIIKTINDPKNDSYIEYLRNPLLLSMFILAFESHPEIPAKKSSFYRNVFDTLYSKHDGLTKNSFPREKLTKLQRDEFEKILSLFSYLTLIEGRYSFTEENLTDILNKVKKYTESTYIIEDLIYDLRTTISILVLDGFEYHFPHRSMQEYFCSLFISGLPSDKKSKAYINLSKVLERSSNDFSFNLWNICYELDNTSFVSYFIIPQLQNYEKALSKSNDVDLLNVYIDLTAPSFHIPREGVITLTRNANLFNAITLFCEVFDFKEFWNFPTEKGIEKILTEAFKDKTQVDLLDFKNETEAVKILLEYKITDVINVYKKAISDKILFYKDDIQRKKNNMDDLLNI